MYWGSLIERATLTFPSHVKGWPAPLGLAPSVRGCSIFTTMTTEYICIVFFYPVIQSVYLRLSMLHHFLHIVLPILDFCENRFAKP